MNRWRTFQALPSSAVEERQEISGGVEPCGLSPVDTVAIVAVYREHHAAVRAFACRLLGHAADAEELTQDVFMSLPAAMARCTGACAPRHKPPRPALRDRTFLLLTIRW